MNRQYFPGKEISNAEGAVQIVASEYQAPMIKVFVIHY